MVEKRTIVRNSRLEVILCVDVVLSLQGFKMYLTRIVKHLWHLSAGLSFLVKMLNCNYAEHPFHVCCVIAAKTGIVENI